MIWFIGHYFAVSDGIIVLTGYAAGGNGTCSLSIATWNFVPVVISTLTLYVGFGGNVAAVFVMIKLAKYFAYCI
jgi:hypothetical protein